MKQNMGPIDRGIRGILGFIALSLGLFNIFVYSNPGVGLLLLVVSLLPISTSIRSTCFLYNWLSINTLNNRIERIKKVPISSY